MLSTCIKLPFVIKIFVLSFLSGRFTQVLLYSKASNKFSICCRTNIYINATGDFLRHENVSREASDFM